MNCLKPVDSEVLNLFIETEETATAKEIAAMAKEIRSLRKLYEAVRWYEVGGSKRQTELGGPSYDPVKSWKHVRITIQAHDNLIGRVDE